MDIRIELVEGQSDALRRLAVQLRENSGAQRVELVHRPGDDRHLGAGVLDFLSVVLGAGGVGTVVAAQIVGWIRTTSAVTLTVLAGAKRFELKGLDVRRMDARELTALIAEMSRAVEQGAVDDA